MNGPQMPTETQSQIFNLKNLKNNRKKSIFLKSIFFEFY